MTDLQYLVPLSQVERELNRQMKALQGEGARPLQRARMSNLIIFCDSLEQSIEVHEQVVLITRIHPTRTLLLVGEPGENREVTARVTVRPVSPNRGDVCVEMVTLHAGGDYVSRLPFAVRSLLLGDLPVNLWWNAPVPPPFAGPLVEDLSEQAQQIIYDSIGWPDPTMGMSAIATWSDQWENRPRRWRVSSDLNWRRLRIWRRLLTQSLDDASAPGANVAVQEILVEHGPHAVLQAWLLVSWLSRHLEWKVEAGKVHPGVEMSWNFQTPTGKARIIVRRNPEGPPEVHRLRVTTTINGLPACLCVEPSGPNRLCLRLEGLDAAARTITMTPHTAIELIGRQLSDRNRDLAFKESLDVAQVMAQSMLY